MPLWIPIMLLLMVWLVAASCRCFSPRYPEGVDSEERITYRRTG